MQETTRDMSPAAVRARLRSPRNAVPDAGYGAAPAPKGVPGTDGLRLRPLPPPGYLYELAETRADLARMKAELRAVRQERALLIGRVAELEGGTNTPLLNRIDPLPTTIADPADQVPAPLLRPSIKAIFHAVARVLEVDYEDLLDTYRDKNLVKARHVSAWLCRRLRVGSYPLIGKIMGGRDHTTIMHGCEKIERLRKDDPALQDLLDRLLATFRPAPTQEPAAA